MFAGAGGVLGDPHGEQVRELAEVEAQTVAAVFGQEGGVGELRPGLEGVVADAGLFAGSQDGGQIEEAFEALLAAPSTDRKDGGWCRQ